MHEIRFTTNWNKKLDNNVFSTIRLQNFKKYQVGQTYDIRITEHGTEKSFKAICVYIHHFYLKNLPEGTAWLDTGYSRAETITIIEKMYKNSDVNVHEVPFSLILLKRS